MTASNLVKHVIRKLLSYAALVLFILVQVVLALGLSYFLLSDSSALVGDLVFGQMLLIGTVSYFVFERITRRQGVSDEAERWLAERTRPARMNGLSWRRAKRLAPWGPALLTLVLFSFFSGVTGAATHLVYGRSAKLLGYRVSFPLTWMVLGKSRMYGDHTSSSASAFDCRGPLRALLNRYQDLDPTYSVMDFTSVSAGRPPHGSTGDTIFSTRTFPFGKDSITCREYLPAHTEWAPGKNGRFVWCETPRGDFSGFFAGERATIPEFYRTLQHVEKVD
jgi:hypothetical protein